jgi:branched-chain amino acid transport system permease protein
LNLIAQLTISGFVLGSLYALLGVSFGLVFQTSKIFHLAGAIPFAVAGYSAVWAARTLHFMAWPALLFGLVASVLAGALILILGYLPLINRKATLMSLFLISLGLSVAFPNLLQIIFGVSNQPFETYDSHKILTTPFDNPVYKSGFLTITKLNVAQILVSWFVVFSILYLLKKTALGRAITALRTNPEMASAIGINSKVVYLVVFSISSLLMGIAGLITTTQFVANPTMGLQPTLIGFIAVFFGGISSLGGSAVGGLVLGLLSSLSGIWFGPQYASIVVFGTLFLTLLVRPQGLFGKETI